MMIQLFGLLVLCAIGQCFLVKSPNHATLLTPKSEEFSGPEYSEWISSSDQVPLILTSYLEKGLIQEGQAAARVEGIFENVESYSGYFTVNKTYNRNLFFWYFPAEEEPATSPVLLWLQGGPGGSSMFGMAIEHGPFLLNPDGSLSSRPYRWTKNHHVIYIDSPSGVGFSFDIPNGPFGEEEIATDLCNALEQFFQLFPHLQGNDFYVSGESYAGFYVPSTAVAIHHHNQDRKVKINLRGLMIGDGVIGTARSSSGSYDFWSQIGLNDFYSPISYNPYNYLQNGDGMHEPEMKIFFNRKDVQRKIHVGSVNYQSINDDVGDLVWKGDGDFTAVPIVQELLEHYQILYYYGQVDTVCPYSTAEEVILGLEWSGSSEFLHAKRHQWMVGDDLAGYIRSGGNLSLALVRNAGHMVPADQPKWGFHLITEFTKHHLP